MGRTTPAGQPLTQAGRLPSAICRPVGSWIETATATATASVTSHTKGAWTEVIAATSGEAQWVQLVASGTATTAADTSMLLDVGIGAAGSEVVIIPNLFVGYSPTISGIETMIPVRVPKGARVAVRCQALISADTVATRVTLYRSSGLSPSAVRAMNVTAASSTAGVVCTTNDTYVEFVSATTEAYEGVIVMPTANTGTVTGTSGVTATIGRGASGSEVAIAIESFDWSTSETCNRSVQTTSAGYAGRLTFGLQQVAIPAGSRLAGKLSTGGATRGLQILGVPYA